jgi:glycerol kinase
VDKLKLEFLDENAFKKSCGLPLANYFSAVKIKWMMENCNDVAKAIEENRCLFGTVDTWIIWNLTGGVNGGKHVTDVSNASRTMLMNLETLNWDPHTCKKLGIPMEILPTILPSSADFGTIAEGPLKGVKISGVKVFS